MPCYCPLRRLLFRRQYGGNNSSRSSPTKSQSTMSGASSCSQPHNQTAEFHEIEFAKLSIASEASMSGAPPKYLLPSNCVQSILSGDIKKIVKLPTFISRDEWIASHGTF